MKILYSPIGQSDPVRNQCDGPWLHICRHIQPDLCVLFLTERMCVNEDKRALYTNAAALIHAWLQENGLCQNKMALRFSRHPEVTDPDIADKCFYEIFENDLRKLHAEHPEADIYCNIGSGTPAMKSCLDVLYHFLPFPIHNCYVRNPKKSADADARDGITQKAGADDYDLTEEWRHNRDNYPGAEKRMMMNNPDKIIPMRTKLLASQIIRLAEKGDFQGALDLMAEVEIPFANHAQVQSALKGAVCRSQLDLTAAGNCLQKAGLSDMGAGLKQNGNDALWRTAEMLLTMEMDISRGDLGSMLRKVTPVLYGLVEQLLNSQSISIRPWLNSFGKIVPEKVREDRPDLSALFEYNNHRPVYPSTANLLSVLERLQCSAAAYDVLVELREKVEESARNQAAHDMPSISEQWFRKHTGLVPAAVMEKLWTVIQEAEKGSRGAEHNRFGKKYRNSYQEITAYIGTLLQCR